MDAVGGHALESFVGPAELAACGVTSPCMPLQPLSKIWAATITPLQPYTFGSFLWDQAETDITCSRIGVYPCLQERLLASYRAQFETEFPFVAVQLPGYAPGVFPMRLAQDRAANASRNAAVIATYDLSCAEGPTSGCPHGNVHNVHKQPIGRRVAAQLRKMKLGENIVTQGPRLQAARVRSAGPASYAIELTFAGGTAPFRFRPTRNCTTCCGSAVSDFDVSADAQSWFNGTGALAQGQTVRFDVEMPAPPRLVRYTANRVFPQCALYNLEGLPALPFQSEVWSAPGGS